MTTGHHDILITAQASVTLCVCFKLTIRLLPYIDSSILMLHSQILQDESYEFLTVNPISQEEFSVGNSPWGISYGEITIRNSPENPNGEFTTVNSPWGIHRESDSPGILREFTNLPGAKNQIPQGEFPMENSLVVNSCEYSRWIPRKFQMNSTVYHNISQHQNNCSHLTTFWGSGNVCHK